MTQTRHADRGSSFRILGLTDEEELVYRELLKRRSATRAQLCTALVLSPEDADRVFASLENKGFVSWTTGQEPRLLASPPGSAVEVLALQVERELQQARVAAAHLSTQWSAGTHDRRADELVEIITGRDAMGRRFESMMKSMTQEILGFVACPIMVAENINVDLNIEALRRGIRSRCIYELAVLDTPGVPEMVARCEAAGEQARVISKLPSKMVLIDRNTALLPVNVDVDGVEPSAALVHAPLTDSLVSLFEELWRRAIPVHLSEEESAAVDEAVSHSPSATDRRMMSLLVAGLSDESVAHYLGISRRTLQRRLTRLMRNAKVDTRLQLVWRATSEGWLERAPGQGRHRSASRARLS